MQVIRIEHPSDGKGIFTNDHLVIGEREWLYRHSSMETAWEINGFQREVHYCAYKSIEELQRWLTGEELKRIVESGFHILLLEVTEFIVAPNQVLYTKTSIIDTRLINDLF